MLLMVVMRDITPEDGGMIRGRGRRREGERGRGRDGDAGTRRREDAEREQCVGQVSLPDVRVSEIRPDEIDVTRDQRKLESSV
jgi:hypothetical protein